MYSIAQENLAFFDIKNTQLFSLKILNTESSASLFVTLLGAWLVRNQFVISLRPRISYKSESIDGGKTWQVRIKNSGLGAAIINSCEFELETVLEKNGPLSLNFEEVVLRLAEIGLVYENDFLLGNITQGFTFPPQEEYTPFQIQTEHRAKITRLTMVLHFQGFLGDKYLRNIVLVPKILTRA